MCCDDELPVVNHMTDDEIKMAVLKSSHNEHECDSEEAASTDEKAVALDDTLENMDSVIKGLEERNVRDIHLCSTPLFLDQRPVGFPPIQVDRFRRVIHGCSKAHYRLLRPPTPPPTRLTPTHALSPTHKGFRFWERAHSPPRPDFSNLIPKPIAPP
ncbi:hypothetical protein AVEN_111518-1 [Araneus ventricosus]|uniref:Uncharacterized protein n=1 Tax=Araneus ventricosus TaxID=182803 RepID=A0A4Y2NQ20_ARAVE|nr:hypothetical protein AVEN_111518-1 [Araneus ventricosus]